MIVNNSSEYEKRKALEHNLEKSELQQKEEMLIELGKERLAVICLALMYAKGFEETGLDITKAWETAEQQMAIIQQNYKAGYKQGLIDGIEKGKEIERQERAEKAEFDRQIVRKNPTKKRHKR